MVSVAAAEEAISTVITAIAPAERCSGAAQASGGGGCSLARSEMAAAENTTGSGLSTWASTSGPGLGGGGTTALTSQYHASLKIAVKTSSHQGCRVSRARRT